MEVGFRTIRRGSGRMSCGWSHLSGPVNWKGESQEMGKIAAVTLAIGDSTTIYGKGGEVGRVISLAVNIARLGKQPLEIWR